MYTASVNPDLIFILSLSWQKKIHQPQAYRKGYVRLAGYEAQIHPGYPEIEGNLTEVPDSRASPKHITKAGVSKTTPEGDDNGMNHPAGPLCLPWEKKNSGLRVTSQ